MPRFPPGGGRRLYTSRDLSCTREKGGVGSRAHPFVLRGGGVHRKGATLDTGLLRARFASVAHQDEASVVVLRAMDSSTGGGGFGSQTFLRSISPLLEAAPKRRGMSTLCPVLASFTFKFVMSLISITFYNEKR